MCSAAADAGSTSVTGKPPVEPAEDGFATPAGEGAVVNGRPPDLEAERDRCVSSAWPCRRRRSPVVSPTAHALAAVQAAGTMA